MNPLLRPMPMTADEIKDLIERTRAGSLAAAKRYTAPRGSYRDPRIPLALGRVLAGCSIRTAARLEGCNFHGLRGALRRLSERSRR